MKANRSGPLLGLKVLEFTGTGPVPFCGMLLSDLGADVLRVDRPGAQYDRFAVETRGRRSLVLDLKNEVHRGTALKLIGKADVLLEGFRPGVMERLQLHPAAALGVNPRLIYGRMTGFGQTGPLALRPGHDLNFVALSGALHAMGAPDRPTIPLNLIGDFGGGALYLAMGVLAALRYVDRTGDGQVIDCSMSDGAASLMSMLYGHLARGSWRDQRGVNIIDGGAPFYNVYQCQCGQWLAVGAIEPQFYRELLQKAQLAEAEFASQEMADWPEMKQRFAAVFLKKTRAEWCALLENTESCVVPVMSMAEAPEHPHNLARQTFVEIDGVRQPAPQPGFSKTPAAVAHGPVQAGEGGEQALRDWGVNP